MIAHESLPGYYGDYSRHASKSPTDIELFTVSRCAILQVSCKDSISKNNTDLALGFLQRIGERDKLISHLIKHFHMDSEI